MALNVSFLFSFNSNQRWYRTMDNLSLAANPNQTTNPIGRGRNHNTNGHPIGSLISKWTLQGNITCYNGRGEGGGSYMVSCLH
ncbi:unnamed protein product [Nezara viridula]|uniref:Uncharacterized protein n=1 Tax=Nezara viridula TaxID=85310 RepID=A0A9P0H4Y5_NEZVI|nr:unnamed protein product [Nezara viridula]